MCERERERDSGGGANKQLMAYKLGARDSEDWGVRNLPNGIEDCAVVRVREREKERGGSENTPSHGIGSCVVE